MSVSELYCTSYKDGSHTLNESMEDRCYNKYKCLTIHIICASFRIITKVRKPNINMKSSMVASSKQGQRNPDSLVLCNPTVGLTAFNVLHELDVMKL